MLQNQVIADDSVMEVLELRNRPASEIQPLLLPLLEAGEVVNGNGFNLIVKTNPERMQTLRGLVKQLDTRLHNLTISVLQSSHRSAEQLNAEAAIAISRSTTRMQGMVGDTSDLDSRQTAQQLRTLEGQAAHIQVGAVRPVQNITVYDSGYGYPGVASSTQMQEASSGFAATPRLIGNDQVMIEIAPWSDRFLTNGGLETQNIQTSVRARLGEWIEIGGSGIREDSDSRGMNGLNVGTGKHELRILIKVERAD
ncbi:type II and III secretion system protein [Methylomonas sp. LL1]|uniref:type II and III secretion system protein n=1 Tax=Methylomonas sp. LL1 TaxID=2785785 RepID=UPI001E3824AF|nr:type II and III secretion system protein [Methylomonas sp. LL1]